MKPVLPTRTVSATATLREQGREIQLHLLGRGHTDGDLYVYLPKERVVATGDALIDWMPFLNDGYPEEWVQTLNSLEKLDFTHIIPGHGDVLPKSHLTFFRGYLSDLIAAVKKAAADGATLDEMKSKIGDQLAPKYEKGMSKYPLGNIVTVSGSTSRWSTKKSSRRSEAAPATKPSTGTRRRATGSAARSRLSSATAPSRAGPSAAIRQGVVTSWPSRRSLTSASGQVSFRPPAVWIGHVRVGRSSSRSARARGTTRNVAPVSTRSSTVSFWPVGPVR